MLTSTRRAIVYPNPDRSDTADVPRDFLAVVQALELDVIFGQGTLAARPTSTGGSPGIQGRVYMATDQTPHALYYDYGTGWDPVGAIASGAIRGSTAGGVQQEILQGTIQPEDISTRLKPSGSAAAGTEALRALGYGAGLAIGQADLTNVNRAGTWAGRPVANTVPAGTLYYVTDEPGKPVYRSDGATWTRVAIGDPVVYYAEKIVDQGLNNVTTDATADTILTSGVINFKQTTLLDLFGGGAMKSTDNGYNSYLFIMIDGVTQILVSESAGGNSVTARYRVGGRRVSVAAGDHTFTLKARDEGATAGTPGSVIAGDGSVSSGKLPAFIEVRVVG